MSLPLNLPAVVAAVTREFESYEKALVENDVAALTRFFWDSEHAVRYGATEELYGFQAISQFRRERRINFTDRTPLRLKVTSFGDNLAITMYEYTFKLEGLPRRGRQTQVWVRFDDAGWKIAAAHVSPAGDSITALEAYLSAASQLQGPALTPEQKPGVVTHLTVAASMASALLEFPLDDHVEPGPTFAP